MYTRAINVRHRSGLRFYVGRRNRWSIDSNYASDREMKGLPTNRLHRIFIFDANASALSTDGVGWKCVIGSVLYDNFVQHQIRIVSKDYIVSSFNVKPYQTPRAFPVPGMRQSERERERALGVLKPFAPTRSCFTPLLNPPTLLQFPILTGLIVSPCEFVCHCLYKLLARNTDWRKGVISVIITARTS